MLVTMGDDFRFQNAKMYFRSSDAMIKYFNENEGAKSNIELIYSTPSMYIDALADEKIVWPTKYDDIFPYADNEDSYWTGYFTSRANDKGYMRTASHSLHSSNKLFALAVIDQTTSDEQVSKMLDAKAHLLDTVGVVQHHDGITGTGKQHVADDYVNRISKSIEASNPAYAERIDQIAEHAGIDADKWQWCSRLNGTYADCPVA